MISFVHEDPMTIEEAMEFCRASRRTIERWFNRGLEAKKIGGRTYTSRGAIDRFSIDRSSVECELPLSNRNVQAEIRRVEQAFGV